jgi:DNA-binding transcriptional ArsR family regulator
MAAVQEPSDAFVLQSPEHFKALGHPVRHRVVNVLRQRPATLRQLTEALSLAKGTVAYHVGILQQANMVHVVETRRVRGGTEQYLSLVSNSFTFEDRTLAAEFLYASARAEMLPERPEGAEQTSLRHLWLTPAQARALWAALHRAATTAADGLGAADPDTETDLATDPETGTETDAASGTESGTEYEGARAPEPADDEAYGLLISLYRADIPLLPPDETTTRTDATPESPRAPRRCAEHD